MIARGRDYLGGEREREEEEVNKEINRMTSYSCMCYERGWAGALLGWMVREGLMMRLALDDKKESATGRYMGRVVREREQPAQKTQWWDKLLVMRNKTICFG